MKESGVIRMREHLFRGRRKGNGEWIEGYLAAHDLICPSYPEDTLNATGEYYGKVPYVGFVEVDPETVGEYTGMPDKNGKRIFEGDIVRHHNGNPYTDSDNIELGKVYWDEKYCGWRRTSNGAFHHGCVDTYRMSPDCVYEVIGNIHDNPELMEVRDETD